jgi:hypothetical protein
MTQVTVLPPQAAPKHPTAEYHSKTLEEHLLAFLNVNNPKGWLVNISMDDIVGFLTEISNRDGLSIEQFKKHAIKLRDMTNKKVKLMGAYEVLSRLYGYHRWVDAKAAGVMGNDVIKNLRYGFEVDIIEIQGDQDELLARVVGARTLLANAKKDTPPKRYGKRQPALITSAEEWEGFRADRLYSIVNDFVRCFRAPHVITNRYQIEKIAAKRFFDLDDIDKLRDYQNRREFPPGFHPDKVLRRERQLETLLRGERYQKNPWTTMRAFLELRPWCATPEVARELELKMGELASGNPNLEVRFICRSGGVVFLLIGNYTGVSLVTVKEKIQHVIVMERKQN